MRMGGLSRALSSDYACPEPGGKGGGQSWVAGDGRQPAAVTCLLFFSGLDLQPLAPEISFRGNLFVAKNMGVAADHLGGDPLDHLGQTESLLFLVEPGQKDDLKKQVTQLLPDIVQVVTGQGLQQFMGFFQQIMLEAFRGLFAVPGAAVGSPESINQGDKFGEGGG
jgi:hypothetical protein